MMPKVIPKPIFVAAAVFSFVTPPGSVDAASVVDQGAQRPIDSVASDCLPALKDIVVKDFLSDREGIAKTADQIDDPIFSKFTMDIRDRLRPELRAAGNCAAVSRLTFVRLPLVAAGNAAGSYLDGLGSVSGGEEVRSPWVDVRFDKTGAQLTVYFSERQFVIDQATTDLRIPVGSGVARPVDSHQFKRYCERWRPLITYGMSDAERAQKKADIRAEMPADIFWLFENSDQSERAGGMSRNTQKKLQSLRDQNYELYVANATSVIRAALENPNSHQFIGGILDLH